MWHRVFAAIDPSAAPEDPLHPADLLEFLHDQHFDVAGHFGGDDEGWFHATLVLNDEERIEIQRYLSTEEGIRRELNSWAAWAEKTLGDDKAAPFMQRFISTTQVITLRPASEEPPSEDVAQLLVAACRYLALATDGIYQVDGRGVFSAEGELLIPEAI